jgi:hypothetical protein
MLGLRPCPEAGLKARAVSWKGRGVSANVLRMMTIPPHTNTNANKVPMLVKCPTTAIDENAANTRQRA